jgi:hypothetical protein
MDVRKRAELSGCVPRRRATSERGVRVFPTRAKLVARERDVVCIKKSNGVLLVYRWSLFSQFRPKWLLLINTISYRTYTYVYSY